jgi:Phytanoyl-CoA dioxygenase (PhyH)
VVGVREVLGRILRRARPRAATSGADDARRISDLVAAQRYVEALDALTEANRRERSTAYDRQLVRLRHDAVGQIQTARGPTVWPRAVPDPFPGLSGLVEASAHELEADLVSGAILHHGCLLVRGLLSSATVACLIEDVDRSFEAQERWRALPAEDRRTAGGSQSPFFQPFNLDDDADLNYRLRIGRMIRDYNSVHLADSPAALFDVCGALEDCGVRQLVSEHFGERPLMTISKSSLRRLPYKEKTLSWHQEIAVFKNPGQRAINCWISLSECGRDAPGLEILPMRVAEIERQGQGYGLASNLLETLALDAAVVPLFEPGDALLFDDLLVHRTAMSERMTKVRYSIENWLFAPSAFGLAHDALVF